MHVLSDFLQQLLIHSACVADLDQAIQKAMQAIGQEPVPLSHYAKPQDREAQLLSRIAQLESQLAAKA